MISYYCDQDVIQALSICDMSGNSGWKKAEDDFGLDENSVLRDDRGAYLYKAVDGKAVLRPEDERKKEWPIEPPETDEVEDAEALRIILGGVT